MNPTAVAKQVVALSHHPELTEPIVARALTALKSFAELSLGRWDAEKIDRNLVISFLLDQARQGIDENSIRQRFVAIKWMFQLLTREGEIVANPIAELDYPQFEGDRKIYLLRKAEELRERNQEPLAELFVKTGVLFSYSTKARRHPRVSFSARIEFSLEGEETRYRGQAIEISRGGIGFRTTSRISPGQKVRLFVPETNRAIIHEMLGEVRYITHANKESASQRAPIFGVSFEMLAVAAEKFIVDYVTTILSSRS